MTKEFRILAVLLAVSSPVWAADPPKGEPTPDARREMAAAHRKMAECLESKRPVHECREEMVKSCQSMMGEEGCPMMGQGDMHGHGHGHGMKPQEPSGSKPSE